MVSAMWVCSQVPADGGPAGTEDHGTQPLQVLSVPRLQRKLKEAARKILRLRLEKEQADSLARLELEGALAPAEEAQAAQTEEEFFE